VIFCSNISAVSYLQCFDTVGWATLKAYGLQKSSITPEI